MSMNPFRSSLKSRTSSGTYVYIYVLIHMYVLPYMLLLLRTWLPIDGALWIWNSLTPFLCVRRRTMSSAIFWALNSLGFLMPNMTYANGCAYDATKLDSTSTKAKVVYTWLWYTRYPTNKQGFLDILFLLGSVLCFAHFAGRAFKITFSIISMFIINIKTLLARC